MARKPVSTPVSGEILTNQADRSDADFISERDVVEAEYETVVKRHQKLDLNAAGSGAGDANMFGLGILSANSDTDSDGRTNPAFWIIGLVLVGAVFWISGGHTLLPTRTFQIASTPANPFAIDDVRSTVEKAGLRSYIVVNGVISNSANDTLPLPDLIIQVNLVDGSTTRYRMPGGKEKITAGGRYVFASKFMAPQNGVENVKVMIRNRD